MLTDAQGNPIGENKSMTDYEKQQAKKKYDEQVKRMKAIQKERLAGMKEEVEYLSTVVELDQLREEVAGRDKYLEDHIKQQLDGMLAELKLGKDMEDKIIKYFGWEIAKEVKEPVQEPQATMKVAE